jgi:hypothetical protein
MSILSHSTAYVLYAGQEVSNNPSQQYGNWKRNQYSLEVNNPSGPTEYTIPPGQSMTAFSGSYTLGLNGSSAFTLSIPVAAPTYRLDFVSGGFSGFRTNRGIDFSGQSVTVTVNNDSVATFSSPVALTGVQVGDHLYVPGVAAGDPSGVFNASNTGYWVIIAISGTSFQAVRPAGESFQGTAEVVPVTNIAQFLIFSAAGVQISDTVEIVAGFSPVSRSAFTVTKVTSQWLEFQSGTALPLEASVVVGATGLAVYGDSKQWVRVETDQPVVLRFNGDTGDYLKVTPTPTTNGWFDSFGHFYSLVIVNKSVTSSAKVILSTVE